MNDHREQGAAAVEFALLLPLLLLLLTSVVDYGLWFSDSISIRQGAREGARQAAVAQYGACTGGNAADKVACVVKAETGALGGDLMVHVRATASWAENEKVIVCSAIKETGVTGLAPLPDDKVLRTRATMRIEVDQSTASAATYEADADPTDQDWSWC